MAKKVREQNKWTIPSDWNEAEDGFQLAVICVPNSRQWRGIFTGQISDLAYGRNYNKLTGTITDAQDIARDIFESMAMTCLDDMIIALQCVCQSATILAEKAGKEAGDTEEPPSDGQVVTGPGEQFPDAETFYSAKCTVSNAVRDTVFETIKWLGDNNIDLLAGLFGGVTSGLIVGLSLAGPAGWAVAIAGSLIPLIAGYLVRYSFSFGDVEDALDETHEATVHALYNGNSTDSSRDGFLSAVDAAATSITVVERQILSFLLSNTLLNQLFEPRPDLMDYEPPDPITCPSFSHAFDFTIDNQGWERDDDDGRPFGDYVPGVGWVSVWGAVQGAPDERLYIRMDTFLADSLTSLTATYTMTGLCTASANAKAEFIRSGQRVWGHNMQPPCGENGFIYEGVMTLDNCTAMRMTTVGGVASDGQVEFIITKIVVTGTGTNPF